MSRQSLPNCCREWHKIVYWYKITIGEAVSHSVCMIKIIVETDQIRRLRICYLNPGCQNKGLNRSILFIYLFLTFDSLDPQIGVLNYDEG